MEYLDFELPIKELEEQIEKTEILQSESKTDMSKTISELQKRIEKTRKEIAKDLTAWQRVQLSRHPNRPYTLAYINALSGGNFLELFGDRQVRDDKAIIEDAIASCHIK